MTGLALNVLEEWLNVSLLVLVAGREVYSERRICESLAAILYGEMVGGVWVKTVGLLALFAGTVPTL